MTETRTLTIKNPGDLLAAVPALLGFHPDDSVVVLTVAGAVEPFHARADLPSDPADIVDLVAQLVEVVHRQGVDQVALVLYSDDDALCARVVDAFEESLAVIGTGVPVAVRADGERWFCAGRCDRGCPEDGTPYDATHHPISLQGVVEGRVVHGSREALRDSLVGADLDEIERVSEAVEVAVARADAAGRGEARTHLVSEGRWVQHRIRRFVTEGTSLDSHDVGRLLVALQSLEVRDVAWAEISRKTAPVHVDLWSDVVRRSPVESLAPPAALLAFAAWLSGHGALAWCAVDRCQDADPGYSMAGLVAQTLACAMPPSAWRPFSTEMLTLFAG